MLVFWVSAWLSVGEQIVNVLLSVSADAVISCLFMPCVPRFIVTSRKLTCTFSHARTVSTKGFLAHSLVPNIHNIYIYIC